MAKAATSTATASPISRPPRNVRIMLLSRKIGKRNLEEGAEHDPKDHARTITLEFRLLPDDHFGPDRNAIVEIGDVIVDETEAARGHLGADRVRTVGAVDAIDRGAEIHGAGAE